MTPAARFRERIREIASVGEWGHLVPLDESNVLTLLGKNNDRPRSLLRQILASIEGHVCNARSYYRIQRAQQSFPKAAKNTAHQIRRVLNRMVLDRQREAQRVFKKFVSGTVGTTFHGSLAVSDWHDDPTAKVNVTVSAIIPTKDAGPELRRLLSLLANQKGFKDLEIIVVDSGSTDDTVRIAQQFGTKIIEISPTEFSHSFARNLGAEQSRGDYILFMVQDAFPPSLTWLWELYQPIRFQEVVASSCAESPRQDSDLMYRTICWIHQGFLQLHGQDRILQKPRLNDYASLRANANVSDIACLIRRDIFLNYKFRGDYAEDLDLGLRLIRDGHKMALLSSTRVIHSHNRSAYYHLRRAYVDTLFMRKVFPDHGYLPVDSTSLIKEIILIYGRLNELSAGKLGPSLTSCSMTALSKIVTDELANMEFPSWPIRNTRDQSTVDEEFQAFVQSVYRLCSDEIANVKPGGALLLALRTFTRRMLEYMGGIYEFLDQPLLEDFKKSLFKAFAFNCGILLATAMATGSSSTRETLREICFDLNRSI
jgi:glycosyltransferase involved in cell wall biosynthesis